MTDNTIIKKLEAWIKKYDSSLLWRLINKGVNPISDFANSIIEIKEIVKKAKAE